MLVARRQARVNYEIVNDASLELLHVPRIA